MRAVKRSHLCFIAAGLFALGATLAWLRQGDATMALLRLVAGSGMLWYGLSVRHEER